MASFSARPFALALLVAAPVAAANITVNTTADADAADADCSLREAIVAANSDAAYNGCAAGTGGSDRILFDLTLPATITLTSDLPEISKSVAIVGPGADQLTIGGDGAHRLLYFFPVSEADSWFVVSGLSLIEAESDYPGPALSVYFAQLALRDTWILESTGNFNAGGLYVDTFSSATIERCWIHGNTALGGGGIGGLYLLGSTSIFDSTISGNTAPSGGAGGIRVEGAARFELVRSTVSGNSVRDTGGGVEIFQFSNGETTVASIVHSTITDNECGDGAPNDFGCGGGLRVKPNLGGIVELTITNSVIAENRDLTVPLQAPDLELDLAAGSSVTSGGFNLVGANDGGATEFPAGSPNANGDFVGTSAASLDPELTALGFNGGPTPTHLFVPLNPHPLVDQGNCAGELAEQRGYGNATTALRVVDIGALANNPNGGDGCDIGAVEAFGAALVPAGVFADGFESGRLLFWSADAP